MSLESLLASEVEAELLELALLGEDALSNCEYTYWWQEGRIIMIIFVGMIKT